MQRLLARNVPALKVVGDFGVEKAEVIFDCRVPGKYRILLITPEVLAAWLCEGHDGEHVRFGDGFLWIEPV